LDVEETLFIINSKTFTTAETMLNARSCRRWLLDSYHKIGIEDDKKIVAHHVVACSTNLAETEKFGIDRNNVFGFWDYIGGRFSVWSAIGALPLSLYFGHDVVKQFLKGGHSIDKHFTKEQNPLVFSDTYVEKCTNDARFDWLLQN
jgi:glucose-6-phosphate isomerase